MQGVRVWGGLFFEGDTKAGLFNRQTIWVQGHQQCGGGSVKKKKDREERKERGREGEWEGGRGKGKFTPNLTIEKFRMKPFVSAYTYFSIVWLTYLSLFCMTCEVWAELFGAEGCGDRRRWMPEPFKAWPGMEESRRPTGVTWGSTAYVYKNNSGLSSI